MSGSTNHRKCDRGEGDAERKMGRLEEEREDECEEMR